MRVEDSDLCVKSLSILIANLGTVEAERFVSLMNQGAGDYTEWRRTHLFEGETVHSLAEKARQTGDMLRARHSAKRSSKKIGIITATQENCNMCMLDTIRAKRDEIYALAKKHRAEKLWVFGSCARKEETPESDVDFLVKFSDSIGLLEYSRFERELGALVGRKAELTVNSVLLREPRFASRVCREAVAL